MAAYIVAQVDITDSARYDEYRKLSSLAIQTHGVEVLVRGGQIEKLEGRDPGRVVILSFPDMAAARKFYDSNEYKMARDKREGAAIMNMLIVEGV